MTLDVCPAAPRQPEIPPIAQICRCGRCHSCRTHAAIMAEIAHEARVIGALREARDRGDYLPTDVRTALDELEKVRRPVYRSAAAEEEE